MNGNCRAVIEAQMASMRLHAQWMGVNPVAIYATGGASVNQDILQIMADVQACPVHRFEVTNSAALGAALRAAHGHLNAAGTPTPWEEVIAGLADPVPEPAATPTPGFEKTYTPFLQRYAEFEAQVTGV